MADDEKAPKRRRLTATRVEAGATAAGDSDTYYFVYGTTMPGRLRYPLIAEFVAETTPATVTGRLYDTGHGYPAGKFGGGEGIHGYLLRLRPERVFEAERTFTEIEAGLYQAVNVETREGVAATAFEWIGSTEALEPIESGTWDRDEA